MPKIPIDIDVPLTRGDRIEMHFRSVGMAYIKAYQIDLLEQRLESNEDFRVISIQTPVDQPRNIIMVVEVTGGQRPAGQTPGATGSWEYAPGYGPGALLPAAIAPALVPLVITLGRIAGYVVGAAALGIIFNLFFKEGYLLMAGAVKDVTETVKHVAGSPIGKAAVAGTGIGMLAMMLAALYVFLPKR